MGQRRNFKEKLKEYFELNENENTTYQNMSDAVKAVLRRKFIALNTYIKKEEKSKISNLCFLHRKLEKEEQIKSKESRRKEIIRLEWKSMKLKTGNQQRQSTKPKGGSLEKNQ